MVMLRVEMGLCMQTNLEAKFEICHAIADVEIESVLAGSPCPDTNSLPEAPQEEGFLCERKVGGGVHCLSGLEAKYQSTPTMTVISQIFVLYTHSALSIE